MNNIYKMQDINNNITRYVKMTKEQLAAIDWFIKRFKFDNFKISISDNFEFENIMKRTFH